MDTSITRAAMTRLLIVLMLGTTLLAAAGAVYTAYGVQQIERRHPPAGRFIDVAGGLRLHYVERGTGSGVPLVLLHGASTSLLDFSASLLPLLAAERRVFAFDRPGYGYSGRPAEGWPDPARQAALVDDALAELGVDKAIWVGHSWSGTVVLAALLNHPGRAVGGVLLAGASHAWESGVSWTNYVPDLPLVGEVFSHTAVLPLGRLLLDSGVETVFAPNSVPPDYAERTGVALTLRPRTFGANAEDLVELSDFLLAQSRRYDVIRQPLLLITGSDDTIVPSWNHAERLQRQVAHAERVDIAGAGHALHHVYPQRVSALIERFAAGIDG